MFQFTFRLSRITVISMIAVGMAIVISSFRIVRAEISPDKSATFKCSSGTACVEGNSTGSKTWGIYGVSQSADGVHGETASIKGNSAVAGIATGILGHAQGVFGKSASGYGVSGESSASGSAGIYGHTSSTGSGVEGVNTNESAPVGNGVYGESINGFGVLGTSSTGPGILADSGARGPVSLVAALQVEGDNSATPLFSALNFPRNASCTIDEKANLTCTGKITGSVQTPHRNSSGEHVLTYASESATATIEDVGTARMYGGVANVRIDPAFASLMDRRWYYVFLTPLGDTRGLYVSMKTPAAFQVRETERGRSSLEFDYRIVAHPLDAENDRLPLAPAMRMPRAVHPTQR